MKIFTADIFDFEKYKIKQSLAGLDFLGDAFIHLQLFCFAELVLLKKWIIDLYLLLLGKEPKTLMRMQR